MIPPTPLEKHFDVAVVGAGILGLAHAYVAARRGKRVVVIERNVRANGASIRNFGFITVTGQAAGETWRLARRTRDVWDAVAAAASIPVLHRGLILTLRRPQSVDTAAAFMQTEMAQGCKLLSRDELRLRFPQMAAADNLGALFSPHELRVESSLALPRLVDWLRDTQGVSFLPGVAVLTAAPPCLETSRGPVWADTAIICPGDDFESLFPEAIAAYHPSRCRLSMMRLASPGFVWPAGVMSDLGLVRYRGYAELPQAEPLRALLSRDQASHLAHGVHMIVVQSADGSLVVGDSHHYGDLPAPFAPAEAETLILDEFARSTGLTPPPVLERWVGVYSVAPDRDFFIDAPADNVRVVMVTTGAGASIAFGLAEKTLNDLFGGHEGAKP